MMHSKGCCLGLAAALATAACLDAELPAPAVAVEQEAIIGGLPNTGDPAVVMMVYASGFSCTGTLIGPRVILTAAHCVEEDIANGTTGSGSVYFGSGEGEFTDRINIGGMAMHRYYIGSANDFYYDIGLVIMRADAPAGVEPMAFNLAPLPASVLGQTMRVVGFGYTDGGAMTGAGEKRKVLVPIEQMSASHIIFGDASKNICQGDSGGPAILTIDGVETVIAVNSYGLTPAEGDPCESTSYLWRTDVAADQFLIPVYDAWAGPCAQDGTCVTDGCRTPDPDCDVCNFDGVCGSGCDRLDLDCPVTGFAGDTCGDGDDCESRVCVAATDDPRVKYCSSACDPQLPIADACDSPLTVCETEAGGHVCRFSGITPTAQGAPCSADDECRSRVCHSEQKICIEQCGDGLPECAAGFACEGLGGGVKACVLPSEDGCAVTAPGRRGGTTGGLGALALGLLLALGGRRRRRG